MTSLDTTLHLMPEFGQQGLEFGPVRRPIYPVRAEPVEARAPFDKLSRNSNLFI